MAAYPGHNYEFYQRVIVAVPLTVPLILVPVVFTLCCISGCRLQSTPQRFLEFAEPFLTATEKQHYIREGRVATSVLLLVLTKAVLAVMFGLAEFLSGALIADTIRCQTGPSWDCFARTKSDGGQVVVRRLANCSSIGQFNDSKLSVECYRHSFEYLTATAELGGVAFITHILINSYFMLYFSVRHIESRYLRLFTAYAVLIMYFLTFVVAPISFSAKYAIFEFMETLTVMMHDVIIAIFYPLFYIVVTMAMLIRSGFMFDSYDTDYNPNTTVITVGGAMDVGGAMAPLTSHTVVTVNTIQVLH